MLTKFSSILSSKPVDNSELSYKTFAALSEGGFSKLIISEIGTDKSVTLTTASDKEKIDRILNDFAALKGDYTGISPKKWTVGYLLEFRKISSDNEVIVSKIPVSLSGNTLCTCSSPNSAIASVEDPLSDRAFSMSKEFHVTGRYDSSDQKGFNVDLIKELLQ